MSELTIYSASAGSGKTFTLAVEYIKLILKSRYKYRHILAVTFTNKATAEMKARIIGELNNLALNKQTAATRKIKQETDLPAEQIRRKAKIVQDSLLHDYSRFSIGTIDHFFQRILTSFARETGLQFGFNLELDNNRILEQAVDNLLNNLDKKSKLTSWLLRFAENRLEEGQNWNFKQSLIDLGKEIFSENYQSIDNQHEQDESPSFFNKLNEYRKNLYNIIISFENNLAKYGNEGLKKINDKSFEIKDFSYGNTGVAGYFLKLAEKQKDKLTPGPRVLEAIDNPEKWVKKTSSIKDEITSFVKSDLNRILKKIIEYYNENFRNYYTAVSINQNLFTFGILADIEKQVREITHDENIFLLSDVPKFLNKIINDNEAPFIYEKTGSNFKYFMIDEFQDTSRMQWENFKPLIINSIAEGNRNMVVGDIKQSIYRWRNSDWKILASLIDERQNVFNVNKKTLTKNWRSKCNIVDFNNRFFNAAKKLLDDHFVDSFHEISNNDQEIKNQGIDITISDVFTDHKQTLPKGENKKGGYVEVSFIDGNGGKDWENKVLEELPGLINYFLDTGKRPGEIAILVRKKEQAIKVMKNLLNYMNNENRKKYNLISDDSLLIKNSGVVNFLLGMFRYFVNPDDDINNAWLINYLKKIISFSDNTIDELFGKEDHNALLISLFPEELSANISDFKNLPLFEMTENLIRIFRLNKIKEEIPFILAFQDLINEYSETEASGIIQFIEWWELKGVEKNIQLSEKLDAVRVLTLHKAKGLQFNTVIVPFCNWKIDHEKNPVLWCEPKTAPFNKFDSVPVVYKMELAKTIFAPDYFQEKLYTFIDNLNLLYVAFTRSMSNLFVMCPKSNNKKLSNTGHLVENAINYCMENHDPKKEWNFIKKTNEKKETIHFGNKKETEDISLVAGLDEIAVKSYPSYKYSAKLRYNPQSVDYFTPSLPGKRTKVNYGKLMHEIFENIKTLNDIDPALEKLVCSGKISKEEKAGIKNNIDKKLKNEQVKDWFSDKWQVKAEADIILKNGKIKRPDRVIYNDNKTVVIDYKFGEVNEPKHMSQIRKYMHYLSEMGYENTEGYLWYAEMDKVIRV